MVARHAKTDDCVQLVKTEYTEMPGLSLTLRQIERLCRPADAVCVGALDRLVHEGFLLHTGSGTYVRARTDDRPTRS